MCLSCLLSDYSITVLIIDLRFDVAMWRSFLFSVSILLVYFISHVRMYEYVRRNLPRMYVVVRALG